MIMPMPVLYLLILASLILYILNQRRLGKVVAVISFFWFLLISSGPVPKCLIRSLENQYSPLTVNEIENLPDSCYIMVLGAGHSDDPRLSSNNNLSHRALGRLVEGIRIQKTIPGSQLVVSGYQGRSNIPQAFVLYRTAIQLRVDSSLVKMLTSPVNTRMEAEEYVLNFGIENDLILVTCAVHMHRAMMLFREVGLDPVPNPTNYLLKKGSKKNPWGWLPSSYNIRMMEAAVHEYIGLLWAKMGGN